MSKTQVIYGGDGYGSAGPTVTVHFTSKHAVQLVTDISASRRPYYQEVQTNYFLQYRYTFGSPASRARWFLTAGSAGGVDHHRTPAFTYTEIGHFDGNTWVPTAPVSHDVPASTHWSVAPPLVPVFGVGVEVKIARRLAARADFSVGVGPFVVVASRAAGGLVVHLGRR